jgi:IS4 transposase
MKTIGVELMFQELKRFVAFEQFPDTHHLNLEIHQKLLAKDLNVKVMNKETEKFGFNFFLTTRRFA